MANEIAKGLQSVLGHRLFTELPSRFVRMWILLGLWVRHYPRYLPSAASPNTHNLNQCFQSSRGRKILQVSIVRRNEMTDARSQAFIAMKQSFDAGLEVQIAFVFTCIVLVCE